MLNVKQNIRKFISLCVVMFFLAGIFLFQPASAAFTWTQTSHDDFINNTLTHIDIESTLGEAKLSTLGNFINEKWTANGVAISNRSGSQSTPKVINDGAGNEIVVWFDGASDNLYAQKIDSTGRLLWGSDAGVAVTTAGVVSNPQMISDGAGGAIISWDDHRGATYDVYAQRINSSGATQWTASGVVISNATSHQRYNRITTDGSGGAIITWRDQRSGQSEISAQRISSAGSVQWTANGIAITNLGYGAGDPEIVSTGSGNAVITWVENRSSSNDIYAQKVNSSGTAQWTANGVVVCNAVNSQDLPKIISDGSTGVIITWLDSRAAPTNIYAQKLDTTGAVPTGASWVANGVNVSPTLSQSALQITTDGLGGIIITWQENLNIYAQRIDTTGAVPTGGSWRDNGLGITITADQQIEPQIVSDNSNGAIIAWHEINSSGDFVYTQKINSNGEKFWASNGEAISLDLSGFTDLSMAFDGTSGAYIVFQDYNSTSKLYTQNIENSADSLYNLTGTMLSNIYDAGASTLFKTISWTETLPANTDITFETRTAPDNIPTIWRDDFNDGNVDNVINGDIAFPEWDDLSFAWPPTEIAGILTFVDPEPVTIENTDDYYFQIDTGYPADYFPGGSTVTAGITIITESPTAELYMFVDGWDIDSGYTSTKNSEVEISYTSALNEPFNTVGFDVYLLDHQAEDNDQFLINYLIIEPPIGEITWSSWSADLTDSDGSTITSPAGRYIQYRANFSTTDSAATPTLSDVTITDNDGSLSGDVNITATLDPSISFVLKKPNNEVITSQYSCNLGTLTTNAIQTCGFSAQVTTNIGTGYTGYIEQDHPFQTTANGETHPIPGPAGVVVEANDALTGFGEYGVGILTTDNTSWQQFSGTCASYDGLTTDLPAQAITGNNDRNIFANYTAALNGIDHGLTYFCSGVRITYATPPGTYSHMLTVTVVGNF